MGATFSHASHLLEADEILFPYPLLSCELEELSAMAAKIKRGLKRFSRHLELSGRRRKILRLMSWDLNPGPAQPTLVSGSCD